MAHQFKPSGTVDPSSGLPLLFCEACTVFSNQSAAQQRCPHATAVPAPAIMVMPSAPTRTCAFVDASTGAPVRCTAAAERTCRGNVGAEKYCGNDFCSAHSQFAQSGNGHFSGYSCLKCKDENRAKKLAEADANWKQMRRGHALMLCPCLCMCLWPWSCLKYVCGRGPTGQ